MAGPLVTSARSHEVRDALLGNSTSRLRSSKACPLAAVWQRTFPDLPDPITASEVSGGLVGHGLLFSHRNCPSRRTPSDQQAVKPLGREMNLGKSLPSFEQLLWLNGTLETQVSLASGIPRNANSLLPRIAEDPGGWQSREPLWGPGPCAQSFCQLGCVDIG